MSTVRSSVVALTAAALVAVGCGLVALQMRAQDARMEALTRELSASRAQLDRATAEAESARAPAGTPVIVGSRGLDPRDLDAIAARVAATTQAQARTDALAAAEATAPTSQQLAKRADAQRKVDAMIASGRARRDDVLALRRELADDTDERSELARQIAVAIDTNRLVPEDPRVLSP